MTATNKPECSKRVFRPGAFRSSPCSFAGKVERDGKWYCKRHDPEVVAAKRAAKEAEWAAERAAQRALSERKQIVAAAKADALAYVKELAAQGDARAAAILEPLDAEADR